MHERVPIKRILMEEPTRGTKRLADNLHFDAVVTLREPVKNSEADSRLSTTMVTEAEPFLVGGVRRFWANTQTNGVSFLMRM